LESVFDIVDYTLMISRVTSDDMDRTNVESNLVMDSHSDVLGDEHIIRLTILQILVQMVIDSVSHQLGHSIERWIVDFESEYLTG